MAFNPQDHLVDISSKKDGSQMYLPAGARKAWFRDVHPMGRIETELLRMDDQLILFKAYVFSADGNLLATAHGTAPAYGKGKSMWMFREVEKAETAAIARALGLAGFGAQWGDDDENDIEHLGDSPMTPKLAPQQSAPRQSEELSNPIEVTEIKVSKTKAGKPMLGLGGVNLFTRKPLSGLLTEEFLDTLTNEGVHKLPYTVYVFWKQNGEYRDFERATLTPFE